MSVLILHLSDIHIYNKNSLILNKANLIAATTNKLTISVNVIFIVISGDIAYSGQKKEYELCFDFICQIDKSIKSQNNIPIYFIVTGGNHDCDMSLNNYIRKRLTNAIQEDLEFENYSDKDLEELAKNCTSIQSNFFDFKDSIKPPKEHCIYKDKLWDSYMFNVNNKNIIFDCINDSWMFSLEENGTDERGIYGKITFPFNRYKKFNQDSSDLRISILHYPFNWFSPKINKKFKKFIRNLSDIVITGHEHESRTELNKDNDAGNTIFIEGEILSNKNETNPYNFKSGFNIINIDLNQNVCSTFLYCWHKDCYLEEKEKRTSYPLLTKHKDSFEINKDFERTLNDPGMNIVHPEKSQIELLDIFVFPDFYSFGKDKQDKKIIDFKFLNDIEQLKDKRIIFKGQEKSGKTALLRTLFKDYLEKGFYPILCDFEQIKKNIKYKGGNKPYELIADETSIPKIPLANQIKEQYKYEGESNDSVVDKFWQLQKQKKILLIDDVDNIYSGYLELLERKLFSKFYMVLIASNETFMLAEELAGLDNNTNNFIQYEIIPFGYKKRSELIKKWYKIGFDFDKDFSNKLVKVEKKIDSILGRGLVPKVPLYMLIILQKLDLLTKDNEENEFGNSAYGYYYEFLISQELLRIKIPKEKLREFFDYCSNLAWFFKNKGKELDYLDLTNFNDEFTRQFYRTNFDERIKQLCSANIFKKNNEKYSFKYSYIYYYFLSKYMSDNIKDKKVENFIDECCAHLYNKDYANTILFLGHHHKEIYIKINSLLNNLFKDYGPINLKEDTNKFNDLSSEKIKFSFDENKNAEERRSKLNEDMDKLNNEFSEPDIDKADGELNPSYEIIILLKAIEVLGQILKNNYTSIKNDEKDLLFDDIFKGSLRVLNYFITILSKEKDNLLSKIKIPDEFLTDNESDDLKSKNLLLFYFINIIIFSFVSKIADSLDSENLREAINQFTQKKESINYKFIKLAIFLNFPEPIPFNLINEIYKIIKDNSLLTTNLKWFVLKHMYIYESDTQERQKLCSATGIDFKTLSKQIL
jgi:hypothetical protein